MVSIDRPLNSLHFRIIFNLFSKDPGPLKSKKRIRAVKQLSLGQVSIMWRPLQNSQWRYALSLISNNIGMPHTAVDSKTKVNLTCLASSRGRQNGGQGHTGIGDLAVCPKFVNLLCRCELYRRRS